MQSQGQTRYLRARNETLRFQFLLTDLGICSTALDLALMQRSMGFAESADKSYSLALRGYSTCEKLLTKARDLSTAQRRLLESRMESLRAAFAKAGPETAHTKSPAPPAGSGNHRDRILTTREVEVLRLIATGKRTKQVAAAMGIAFKTAACHRYRLMEKLGVHDLAGLMRYAIREGIAEV